MVEYRFRLTGVPQEEAIKSVDIDESGFISEVKETLYKAYKINPVLGLQFIHKGRVLPNHLRFASFGIRPQRDVVTLTTFEIIPDFESLNATELPLDSIKQLIQKASIEDITKAGIQALGKVLVKIGIEIAALDKLEEPFHWRMVEERIQILGEILKRGRILPLTSISHLVNKAIRYLGPGVGNPRHQCGETVEVAIGAILEDIGFEIASLAKKIAEDSNRKILNETDIRSAFQRWRETQ